MGKRGQDISGELKLQIYTLAKAGKTAYKIWQELPVSKNTARKWSHPDKLKEIEKSQSFEAKRKGFVGRKEMFSEERKEELLDELEMEGMTQIKLAKKIGCDVKTLRSATRWDAKDNPNGAYPYKEKSSPELTPRIQKQSVAFVKKSPIGKAAQKSKNVWNKEKRKWGFVDHSPCPMSGAVNRTHRPQWKRKKKKKTEGLDARRKGNRMNIF